MARHFLSLYLLIVLTLTAVSWGQDKLLQTYGSQSPADEKSLAVAMFALENQLHGIPTDQWKRFIAGSSAKAGADMELFATTDIAGRGTLAKLKRGEIPYMQSATGESWALKQLNDDYVLALKSSEPETQRGLLEWTLTLLFYAAIALVIMIWIWPLTRDLRALEKAASRFGNKNRGFDASIKTRSQIYPLAETFRKMAARIDGLIASHKDLSNAVAHEIKTPLARMQFEIEAAQRASDSGKAQTHFKNIKQDIAELNALVTATLDYAVLERADMALNLGRHDFTKIVPAIVDSIRRDGHGRIEIG